MNPATPHKVVQQFIQARCLNDEGSAVRTTSLYRHCDAWISSHGRPLVSFQAFLDVLAELGYQRGKNGCDEVYGLRVIGHDERGSV